MVMFKYNIFGTTSIQVILCILSLSPASLQEVCDAYCLQTGDADFDHLVKVGSTTSQHGKCDLLVISN